jgi:S1-C subfamily serine protease
MVSLDILRDGKKEVVTIKLENQKKRTDKQVKKSLPNLSEPPLGLEIESSKDGNGIMISRVYSGSPADKEGLQSGDRIEAINGRIIKEVIEFIDILNSVSSESKVHLLILRNKVKFHLALVQRD